MNTITLENAQKTLPKIVRDVIDNVDQMLINVGNGESVVLLSQAQFNAWQETMYLLSTPANASHLLESIAQDKARNRIERALIDV